MFEGPKEIKMETQSIEKLASELLSPYNNFIFLVHPLFHQILNLESIFNNQFYIKDNRKQILFSTDKNFNSWVASIPDHYEKFALQSLRRGLDSLRAYPNMYIKYKMLINSLDKKSYLLIIPADNLFSLSKNLLSKYHNLSIRSNVSIPDPNNIQDLPGNYTLPNMRIDSEIQMAQWLFESLANETQGKRKDYIVDEWLKNKHLYFKNKTFQLAGEYTNLCVNTAANSIYSMTGKEPEILDNYTFELKSESPTTNNAGDSSPAADLL